jgi:hypothetical protein
MKYFKYEIDNRDLEFFSRIFCRNDRLTIGAPSSPMLTNILMFDFDTKISEISRKFGYVYTRYADDMHFSSQTFSTDFYQLEDAVRSLGIHYEYGTLMLNDKKKALLSRMRRRVVTGITLTSDFKLSLGRARKRKIRTLVFLAISGVLDKVELRRLQGEIAFAKDADPEFYSTLVTKYGEENIKILIRRSAQSEFQPH